MRWLLPLGALLAFALGCAWFDRNPNPFLSLQTQISQQTPQVPTDQKAESPVRHQQRAESLGSDSLPSQVPSSGFSSTNDAGEHGKHGSEEGTEFTPVVFGYKAKITDVLSVLLAFALAVFTWRLWKSTDKLTAIGIDQHKIMALQTSIQQELAMPRIFVSSVIAAPQKGFVLLSIAWKNGGGTIAQDVTTGRGVLFTPDRELGRDFDYGVDLVSAGPIAPSVEIQTGHVWIDNRDWHRATRSEETLFVWGTGRYRDQFSPATIHCVDFCYRMSVRHDGVAFLTQGEHNRAYDIAAN